VLTAKRSGRGVYRLPGTGYVILSEPGAEVGYEWYAESPDLGAGTFYGRTKRGLLAELTQHFEERFLKCLRDSGAHGVVRTFMDPIERQVARGLVKQGRARQGVTPDKQASVVYFSPYDAPDE